MDNLPDPDPFNTGPPSELPPDETGILNPPENACEICGEEVVRGEDGVSLRGRIPKMHPSCKASVKGSSGGERRSVTGTTRVVKVSKKDEEIAVQVELAIEQARRHIAKAVGLLSLVDPYDAFVIHINAPEILDNLRFVLMRFEWLRNAATGAQTGGSVLGLILAVLTTVLPIMAHHGLIPGKKVANIILNIPFLLLRLQQAVANGNDEDIQNELMRRIAEEGRKAQERKMRQQTEEQLHGGQPTHSRQVP